MTTYIKFKSQKYGFKAENIKFEDQGTFALISFDRIKSDGTIEYMKMPYGDFESIVETTTAKLEDE